MMGYSKLFQLLFIILVTSCQNQPSQKENEFDYSECLTDLKFQVDYSKITCVNLNNQQLKEVPIEVFRCSNIASRGGQSYITNYAGQFEKKVENMKEGDVESFVILSHDTSDSHLNEAISDKNEMEKYAEKNGVKIEYLTMSSLFERLTHEDAKTYRPNY